MISGSERQASVAPDTTAGANRTTTRISRIGTFEPPPNGWTLSCGRPYTPECRPADAVASTTDEEAVSCSVLLGSCAALATALSDERPGWDAAGHGPTGREP